MTAALSLTIEITAAAFGVLGTLLLALKGKHAGWGFVSYLASNAGWVAFAWMHGHFGLLAQQLAFTATSLVGIWIWIVKPRQAQLRLDVAWQLLNLSGWLTGLGARGQAMAELIDDLAFRIAPTLGEE
jgi:nicotinamide riboside transporter PnuC